MKKKKILSLEVACTDYSGALEWVFDKAKLADRAYAVEAANTHVIALAKTEERFYESMKRFDLILPDGMPLVWALNRELGEGEKLTDRVYGPTLMLKALEADQEAGAKHFFLGGADSTLEKLRSKFDKEFPDVEIAGMYSPPFGAWPEGEFDKICELIADSGANLIWVGLGCPKQENWIADNLDALPAGVYFGIGAAFAFHAGEVKQAPPLLQKIGMEWLYRLCAEPRRLWRRYFIYNSLFVYHYVKQRLQN